MSTQKAVKKSPQPPKTLLALVVTMLKQAPKNLIRQIPMMLLMAGFTWVFHTYLLVYVNQGFNFGSASRWTKAALSVPGSQSGVLFWTLTGGIASFLFAQLKQNGLGGTMKSIGTMPGWIIGSFKDNTRARLPLILGSLGAGFLAMVITNSPLYALQLGILLIGEWLAQGKGLFGMVLPLGWSDMQKLFNRSRPPAPFKTNYLVLIMLGLSVSAICGLILPAKLLIACMVGAIILLVVVLIKKPGKPIPRATIILLALVLSLSWLGLKLTGVVSADDCGWTEGGANFGSWIGSDCAGLTVGVGFKSAFGSFLGWLLGSGLAKLTNLPTVVIPETSNVPDWIADPEVRNALDAWQKELEDARREAEKYTNQWEQVKDGYDVNDPNYQNLKNQYKDYIDFQNKRAAEAQSQIDQMRNREANAQQEQRYINATEKHRAENKDWLDKQREKLEKRDTAFDHEVDQSVAANKEKMEKLVHAQKIRREANERSWKDYGKTGERDPVFGAASDKADKLVDDILSGKEVTATDIEKVSRVVKDRVAGATKQIGEEKLPSNWEVAKDFATGSVRTTFTGTNPNGSTNWGAIVGRVWVGISTVGASEWVYTPVNMTYVSKDAIDRGASSTEALRQGLERGATDYVMGKAIQGTLKLGGKALGATGRAAKSLMPGTSAKLGRAASAMKAKVSKFIGGLKGPKQIPTAELDSVNRSLKNALRSGDEKAIANLYRNGGMKNLAKLEQLGHISAKDAKVLNRVLSKSVDSAIDKGTKNTMKAFQAKTGVKVKRTLVGDSGSSAKGGNRSVKTDFDRTSVPEFDPKSLSDYATKNGMSPAEAEKLLSRRFKAIHQREVDKALKDGGMVGGAKDVDYKTYDGIGSNAGQGDAYPYGHSSQSQGVGGNTKVYTSKADGTIRDPVHTSGQSTVDADGLKKLRTSTEGKLPANPNTVTKAELPSIINEQAKSANSHTDVKSLAKGLGRTEPAARRLGIQNPNLDELGNLSNQIRNNPQQVNEILDAAGLGAEEFVEKARSAINQVNDTASKMKIQ